MRPRKLDQRGVTLIELGIALVITAALVGIIISFAVDKQQQSAQQTIKNDLLTTAETGLNTVANDIRLSARADDNNRWQDTNAPGAPSNQLSWQSNGSTLVLATAAQDGSRNILFDDVHDYVTAKNNYVYFVSNHTLYRRTLAAPKTGNAAKTTCPASLATASCPADKVMVNMRLPHAASSTRPRRNQRGMILVSVLIITSVLMIIGFALISSVTGQYRLAGSDVYTDNALLSAEAGVEQSVEQLNQNDNFTGYPSAQTLFNDSTQGYGIFVTTIASSPDDSNAKIITSTGTIYHYGQTTNPVSTRKVKVTVVGTSSNGYSVHTGPGGLILGGSANITNSDVYVNGTISLTGTSKIGTQAQPLKVFAGNYACPTGSTPGSTYPQVCSGTQPISLAQSTAIYGTVCATGQTSTGPNNNIKTGSTGQGLVPGCVAPQVATPTYDRAAQIAAVTTTKTSTDPTIDCTQWQSGIGFKRTWPANLKITGNVNIASSCDLTLTGNVYITGTLTIGGAAIVRTADSLGTTRPVVIVDGTITTGGSGGMTANSSGTGAEFISFKSSAPCNPSCTSVTGTDLKTSQALQTVTIGGGGNLAASMFDAYWGKITIKGSGNIGAAIGQTVDMSGAGTVTFGTGIAAGARTWTITSYQQLSG
jgi:Tfp pilus assembly protein PilX/type II secretory pathway component PulJ